MDSEKFQAMVEQATAGKQLPDALYLHKDAFEALPNALSAFIHNVAKALKIDDDNWHIVKLSKNDFRLSLLSYPTFYTDAYPSLKQSVTVDLTKLMHRVTDYEASENPPILHRKELMILPSHPAYPDFEQITQEGENAGLYENSRLIGFKQSWLNLIKQHGYTLVDGRLFRSAMVEDTDVHTIDRHKTAIVRHSLSAPMKALAKNSYLSGDYSVFDYGCGRGDDMRELLAHCIDVLGWDPTHYPDGEKTHSDIVNLGFVLNVIEDIDERLDALLGAWELADKLLVVSVMLGTEQFISQFTPYKDGVITSRNTFQKYYQQSEIKAYVERTLDEQAITIAPGIFYIFKDKLEEQAHLQNRYRRHQGWKQLTAPKPPTQQEKLKLTISQHAELFEAFWMTCLVLGRIPANDEFEQSETVRELIGSHKKTHKLLCEIYDEADFEAAELARREDLLLYFAMTLFEKRKPYTQQPEALKRDIKAFFDDYKSALTLAQDALYQIANPEKINQACVDAHTMLPASILNDNHSLIFHQQYTELLPQILRIYVGAGLHMYGDLENIDLVKIHIRSGKLTLTTYDNFDNSAVPFLVERVKIKMAEQDIDFFDYVAEEKRPPLLNKGLLLGDDVEQQSKQRAFDKRLAELLGVSHLQEVLMGRAMFERRLREEEKVVNGHKLLIKRVKNE
ncbi:DNA phosphorothioation-associated putative methyltransferase [Enterovibrio norvegicus]|uniref:DNA phosphorothioation-associated putative methyltransferase n=1 Tax=Enterovibrio norvegicus DSM 15893 TaxID=1121869 RepID=A0A1I5TEC8_9GAMM|nr:DNA phosphorothioation-associated putative methyltransferase [Enterovibrio norvegicus]SFP81403.1 DNA phosphorothioation-associated putative methyltransferase [Enterovibrio norvegicus DSM 15893]